MGLTIAWDVLSNEYAEQFNIYIYNVSGLYKTINVIDNDRATYEYIGQLDNYIKIVLEVVKWCKPYRRAKIVEVDFGIIRTFEGKSLIRLSLIQELEPTSANLPTDEFKFTVDNSNRDFNILNPQGFYKYIKEGQEVFFNMGVETEEYKEIYEDVQVGKFYLKEQQSDEGTLTSTFTTRDIFEILNNTEIQNLVASDMTLYDFAIRIFNSCGIEGYKLSNNLKLIKTKGLYKKMSYKDLIQMIAIAGMCVIYSNHLGEVEIKQLIEAKTVLSSIVVTNTEIIGNKDDIIDNILVPDKKYLTLEKDFLKLDGTFNLPSQDSENEKGWLSSTFSNESCIFVEPLVITINLVKEQTGNNIQVIFDTLNNEYATDFVLKAYDSNSTLLLNKSISSNVQNIFAYSDNGLIGAKKIEITINKWCKPFRRARVYEIGFNLPVDNVTFDNMYNEPRIVASSLVKTVEVTYYPKNLQDDNKAIYAYVDESIKDGTILKLENFLINTEADAINVAKWIVQQNKSTNTFTVNWRANPALCLADKVSVQNGYGLNNIVNITKQEFNYEGYLSGTLEGKGVI